MTCKLLAAIVTLSLSIASPLAAQQSDVSVASRGARGRGATARLESTVQARINGVVVTMHEPPKPVPHASVRLRTSLGKAVEITRTNEKGEFAFVVGEGGSYYVELIDDKGRVLAVEDVGETTVSVGLGQVSTTIIRVPVPLVQGAWASAAKAILAAAASSGVAGVTTTGQPASPEK